MARRRLKMMMDLSVINNSNSNVKNEHNVHNLTDIISSATIVFDEPEINSVVGINNEVLAFPLEHYTDNFEVNSNNINIEDDNRMLDIPLDNFEVNTVNADINIEDYNRMLEIPLENFELNSVNSDINIEDYNRILEIPLEHFELNTVNSDINIEENNDNMLEIPLATNIPLCYELLTEDILKPNDISNENEQMDVENINVNNVQSKANDTRNIKPQPNKWKRQISQRCRMSGQEYMGFQRKGNVVSQDIQRPARSIQPMCKSKFCIKAKNRFCQSFNENQRLEIFSTFWDSSWEAKKTFSCNMVTKMITKSNTTGCNDSTRRLNTYTYHLKYKDLPALQVCKKMFLNTLGMNEFMLHSWVNESNHGIPKVSKNTSYDNLGRIIKLSPQSMARKAFFCDRLKHIKSWFNSLAKMPSHYCRGRTNRLYLEGPFSSLQEVFNCYKKKCTEDQLIPLSKCFFNQYMKENKVSIFKPRKDQCDLCSAYENFQVSEEEYAMHIALKNSAREEKQKDKKSAEEKKCYCFTIDMQAVKLCPAVQASSLYYSMKLKVHNLTIYNLATNECSNYWWHEGEADLEASVFATIIIKHLLKKCTEQIPIIIYSDGCGYQNRNVILSNALLQFCKTQNIVIKQKFLIKGHTQMECDSAHSLIERKIKNKDIFLPSDYVRLTTESRNNPSPFEAILLTHSYFYDFKHLNAYTSIRPGIGKGEPEVKDIRELLYDPSTSCIYFKLLFDDPYCAIPKKVFPRKKTIRIDEDQQFQYKPLYKKPLNLSLSKWNDLQKLKRVLPIDTHSFYDTLLHCNELKTKKGKV